MSQQKILIFSESSDMAAELVTAARELSGADGFVTGLAIGPSAADAAHELLRRGVDEALAISTSSEAQSTAEELRVGLTEVARSMEPNTVLIAATRIGNDVTGRLAQALAVPCATNCVAAQREADGNLKIQRRVYGGRFTATQILSGAPQIVSLAASRFPKAESGEPRGEYRELDVELPAPAIVVKAAAPRAKSSVDVSKARVIVAAGRGIKKAEDISLLEALAEVLGGVVAGSRPLTGDVDWLPTDRRIGLSGQTVKPNLYLACGISGQIEHVVGMKGARTVVAINNDPKAPIHSEADYSIIGDLYEVVPALVKALKK
jgi:electron transfer flavoprotein alpha subunit